MSRTASTVINAPAATIFAILTDPAQHQVIDGSGNVKGSPTGAQRLELGSEFGMSMKQGASYKTANKVVEFEPDKLIAWRHNAPHRWRYELTPDAGGATKVVETWDTSYFPIGLRQGMNLVLGRKTQKGLEQTLVKLKALAEEKAPTAP
jgi:uncharacterized protein YndB with AHSA1/START domain